jgi:thiamine-monophosphate kinase
VSATVDVASIPLSPAATQLLLATPELLETALTGGDDYEILASIPSGEAAAFESAARAVGVPVARIGGVIEGQGPPTFRDARGQPMHFTHGSFSHF